VCALNHYVLDKPQPKGVCTRRAATLGRAGSDTAVLRVRVVFGTVSVRVERDRAWATRASCIRCEGIEILIELLAATGILSCGRELVTVAHASASGRTYTPSFFISSITELPDWSVIRNRRPRGG
jgi:hypothetical protein